MQRPSHHPQRPLAAVGLLVVLLAGLVLPAFTQDWLEFLPHHDHLISGVHHGGTLRHIHAGDELDRASRALTYLGSTTAPGGRVLSFRPVAATQPEISTYTFSGGLALVLAVPPMSRGRRLWPAERLLAMGLTHPPRTPPPRLAQPVAALAAP